MPNLQIILECSKEEFAHEDLNSLYEEALNNGAKVKLGEDAKVEVAEAEEGGDIEEGYRHIEDCISWCRKYNLNMVLDLHKTHGYIFDDQDYSKDFFHNKELQERFLNLWKKT